MPSLNPFDLPGPAFLLFYLAVGTTALLLHRWQRRSAEAEGGRATLSDPYQIAYLRGGANEVLRVATVSLLDRHLLKTKGSGNDLRAKEGADKSVENPVERAVLEHFEKRADPLSLYADAHLTHVVDKEVGTALRRQGLVPDDDVRRTRRSRLTLTIAAVWIIAFVKIVAALSRDRTNVGFLVVLALVFAGIAVAIHNPRLTARGEALLTDLRTLFSHLKGRAQQLRSGASTSEMALLAAVYGLGALPASEFGFARQLFPRASTTSSASRTSTCGSSCGSSCGSMSSSSSSSSSSGGSSDSGSSCGGGGGCGGCGGGGGD